MECGGSPPPLRLQTNRWRLKVAPSLQVICEVARAQTQPGPRRHSRTCSRRASVFPEARRAWRTRGLYVPWSSNNSFLCFAGRFLLSAITRVPAGAIPDSRASRRATCPTSKIFFFRFFILIPSLSRHEPRARDVTPPQNPNVTCRSTRRLAVLDEYGPPTSPLDSPKRGELRLPMGVARFTLFKTFRAEIANVRL